jgi:type I restriction enzyme R subunit
MTPDQEVMLTTVLANELKSYMAEKKQISIRQIELKMTHVKDIKVNYDYLTELVNRLLNEVHEGKTEEAEKTQDSINQFANGLKDRNYAGKIIKAAEAIKEGHYPPKGSDFKYPAEFGNSEEVIIEANNISLDRTILDFRIKWGIVDVITSVKMRELFANHKWGEQDLNDRGQIQDIIKNASENYAALAHDEAIQDLPKIKYRNELREAIYKLADELTEV